MHFAIRKTADQGQKMFGNPMFLLNFIFMLRLAKRNATGAVYETKALMVSHR